MLLVMTLLALSLISISFYRASAVPKPVDEEVPYQVVTLIFSKGEGVLKCTIPGLGYDVVVDDFHGYVIKPKDQIYKLRFVARVLGAEEFDSKDPAIFTKLYLFKKAIGFPFDNYAPIEIDYFSWGRGTYLALNRFCSNLKAETVIKIPAWNELPQEVREEIVSSYRSAFGLSFVRPSYRPLAINIINRTFYNSGELQALSSGSAPREPRISGKPGGGPLKETPKPSKSPLKREISKPIAEKPNIIDFKGSSKGGNGTSSDKKALIKKWGLILLFGLVLIMIITWLLTRRGSEARGYTAVPSPGPRIDPKTASQLLKTATYNSPADAVSALETPTRAQSERDRELEEETLKKVIKRLDELYVQFQELKREQEELKRMISSYKTNEVRGPEDGASPKPAEKPDTSSEDRREAPEPYIPKELKDDKKSMDIERIEAFLFQLEKLETVVKKVCDVLDRYIDDSKFAMKRAEILSKLSGLKDYVRSHRKLNLSRYDEIIKRDIFPLVELMDRLELEGRATSDIMILRKDLLKATDISEIAITPGKTRVNIMEHKVVDHIYSDDFPEGTIVEVLERGYKYKGKVIKRAKVVEAKKYSGFE